MGARGAAPPPRRGSRARIPHGACGGGHGARSGCWWPLREPSRLCVTDCLTRRYSVPYSPADQGNESSTAWAPVLSLAQVRQLGEEIVTTRIYALPIQQTGWQVPGDGTTSFSWEYDQGRDRLLTLYEKGKHRQWNASERIDWSMEVDRDDPLGIPDEAISIYGSPTWERLGQPERAQVRLHMASWQFSQFLHGEQGALICASKIVQTVPDMDSKFYAATQVMDEARHVEAYSRYLHDKLELAYPINPHLQALLNDVVSDPRWDMTYLGMQVLFGRLALRDLYPQLTQAERDEREEFCVEACLLMRDRFTGEEIWRTLDFDADECVEYVSKSETLRQFRSMLFSRIVPTLRDIGLFGPKVKAAFAKMGVLGFEQVDVEGLMATDERVAEEFDAERVQQVDDTIAAGADAG